MSTFYDLMAAIEKLHAEAALFEWEPLPGRAFDMLLLAECVASGLQAYLHPFAADRKDGNDNVL